MYEDPFGHRLFMAALVTDKRVSWLALYVYYERSLNGQWLVAFIFITYDGVIHLDVYLLYYRLYQIASMTTLHHWTIALDLSKTDHRLLEYSCLLAQILKPRTIELVIVESVLDIPSVLDAELPDLRTNHLTVVEKKLNERASQYLKQIDAEVCCQVYEGNPFTELLKHCRDKETDLLVMGKKPKKQGQGVMVQKMARKGPCSLLVVPQTTSLDIDRIMLPIDFSEYSRDAIVKASNLCKNLPNSTLILEHVYQSANWYLDQMHETIFEVEEHLQKRETLELKLENYFYDKLTGFLKEYKLTDIPHQTKLTSHINRQDSISYLIMQDAREMKADLLIMGAKGKSSPLAVLMGSVAEKVNRLNQKIPLLILRKKGENTSLIRTLLGY